MSEKNVKYSKAKAYINELPTSRKIGVFWKVLFKWKGSVYKLLYIDLLIYLSLYYAARLIYVFALDDRVEEKYFEEIIVYCRAYSSFFPISFVLGFFVSTIMTRWWSQYTSIPRPHGTAVYVSSSLQGNDELAKAIRRTIVRYVCCSITMVFRTLSPRVLTRFKHESDLVKAGFLDDNEYSILQNISENHPGNLYVVPLVWATTIITKTQKLGRISSDIAAKTIIDEINNVRTRLATLINYQTVNISLVYSQVVTLACYSYFLAAIFGSQTLKSNQDMIDFGYFPIFLVLQFIFYMGWLKVGEALMNPFGDDDDDFDVFSMVDNFLLMSYLIVDRMHNEHPTIIKDLYWGQDPNVLSDFDETSWKNSSVLNNVEVDSEELSGVIRPVRRQAFSMRFAKIRMNEMPQYQEEECTLQVDPDLLPKSNVDIVVEEDDKDK